MILLGDGDYDITLLGHHLDLLAEFYFLKGKERMKEMLTKEYDEEHAKNTLKVLRQIVERDIRIKIIRMQYPIPSAICKTCPEKNRLWCLFDQINLSYGGEDDQDEFTADFYGLEIDKVYDSKYILEQVRKMHEKLL